MGASQSSKPGPVAVIAVHGVADQERDKTAVRAANMLLHLNQVDLQGGERPGPRAAYAGFEQEKIRVGLEPLNVSGMGEEDAWQYQLRRHLEHYQGEGTESYETVRMEGYRLTKEKAEDEPKVDRPVHVYELYWADASRLPIGILNLFLGIYRLLFQTSWLGTQTMGKWASFGKDVGRWSKVTSLRGLMLLLNHVSSMILTRFMPLLYLMMIAMLALMAIPVVESSWAQAALGGLGGYPGLFALAVVLVVAALLIGGAAKVWRRVPWPPLYAVVAVISFLAWNVAFAVFQDQTGSWRAESGVALAAWGVICLLIGVFVVPGLGKRFPGAGIVGLALMGYFTVFLLLGLTRQTEWPVLISGPMLALRMGFALLPFAWMILATCANLFLIMAAVHSVSLWFRRGLGREVIRRKRARLRTAAISIILPVLLISFLNSTFFLLALVPFKMGLVDGAPPIAGRVADMPAWVQPLGAKAEAIVEPLAKWASMPGFAQWANSPSGQQAHFSDFAKFASQQMVVPFLEAVFLAVLLVLGYSLWVVAPAALGERTFQKAGKRGDAEKLSRALGENLSQGYRWLWSGQVVLAGCLLFTQFMFAYRGNRAREIQADPSYGNQPALMKLVDQFLGIRHLGQAVSGPAVAQVEALAPAPSGAAPAAAPSLAMGRAPVPVAEVSPAAAPAPRSPGQRSWPLSAGRSPSSGQKKRFVPPANLPVQQVAYEQRQEVRETIEGIFKHRAVDQAQGGAGESGPARLPALAVETATEGPPPSLLVKTITEAVLFLNTGPLTSALGASILILGLGYLFFARLVDPILAGLRGGLDIALDVLNYLRPRPLEETPRARILSRFASLLRYISNWRDPNSPEVGYSRIVILAHSQGSVISSDILRALSLGSVAADNDLHLLRSHPDAREGIPIRLFTMGSPLRQLYAARFPDLYAWDSQADPRVSHRALECWWNAYRSGDYVGRMLFRDESDPDSFVPGHNFVSTQNGKALPVQEICLGPGGHVHYWDGSAPAVIRNLDRLIACDHAPDLCSPSTPAKTVGT